jgi:hypothetical protein
MPDGLRGGDSINIVPLVFARQEKTMDQTELKLELSSKAEHD